MAAPPWFRPIFDAHYPEVVRHVRYLLGDTAEAEDIAQETFLRLYLSMATPPAQPRGWLLRVATRLAYNHLRGSQRRRLREVACQGGPEPVLAGPAAADPGERADAREVWAALDRLAPRDRLLILLHAAGYRYREIAELLDLEPGSVGALLARARQRFAAAWRGAVTPVPACEGGQPR